MQILTTAAEWMERHGIRLHFTYHARFTDVYIGKHGRRLIVTSSWFGERSQIADIVNEAVCLHELGHVLAERDPDRLAQPNFGMVRYTQPVAQRDLRRLDPAAEILTEARAQAITKSIRRAMGLEVTPEPVRVDPHRALEGLPFTIEQSTAIVRAHEKELAALATDSDVLCKLEESIARIIERRE